MTGIKGQYEKFHGIIYDDDVIPVIVKLSRRYIPERSLPDKAIDILDEAGAQKKILEENKPQELVELEAKIAELVEEKKNLVRNQEYENAALVRDKVVELKRRLEEMEQYWAENGNPAKLHVTSADICHIISDMTGIPVDQLDSSETARLIHMEEEMHKTVIGQNDAVHLISGAIRRSRAGISSPKHPIGSFIFLGPTGVGKTQLAKALACGDFIDIMRECLISDTQSAYRFRISANEDIRQLAMEMEALSGGALVNSPSDYDAEIKLYRNKEGMYFPLLILPGMPDARFRYRKEYVAGSMTPVNAACVVNLAKEYLARGAQVIDPFCGVGTLLIERSKAVKCRYMYGIDTFGDAIEGAKHNSAAAHVEVNYIHRDYFDFTTEYLFDELITDMPVISEGRADYIRRFLDKTATIIKSGGVCIIYGPYGGELVRAAKVRADYEQVRSFELNSKDGNSLQIIKYRG